RGDYNSPELDFSSPLDKLKLAHPTFRFVRGSDVFFEQNYGTDPHNGEVYLHDLHVFGKPHSKQTIDWLKQTVALTKETKAWLELVGEIKKNKKKTSG
ncbi:hypothetical protein HY993_04775, partial [Candidatus Micrarchaeota archaeon]|nr:hypothetical protein [Candidatus Micrarchaeota archaeon]